MIRVEKRIHARSLMVNRRESCKIKRTLFLNGKRPLGFLFSKSGYSFHLMKNNEETFCGWKIKYSKPLILFRTLKEAKESGRITERKRELCIQCENNFIGLGIREKYNHKDGHIPLYSLYDDNMYISKHLDFMLNNPYDKNYPHKREDQLQDCIFLNK